MQPLGVDRMVGVVLQQDPADRSSIAMSLYRGSNVDAFDQDALAFLDRIGPHLSRAIRLGLKLSDMTSAPGWSLALLDQLPWGVFLIAASGQVVFANGEAERTARAGDGLRLVAGRLIAAKDDARLHAAIAYAIAARAETSGRVGADLLIARPSGLRPYIVTIAPLGLSNAILGDSIAPRAAVYVIDPTRHPSSTGKRLADLLRLTPAERRVAEGLLEGLTLADLAERHWLSQETIRSQLKSLFHKTGTNRQGELLSLLARLIALPRHRSREDHR
jgi:DNA-binding CsgD family transcriptional regulator